MPPSLCTQTDGNNWILLPQAAGCGGNKISCGAFVASNAPMNGSKTPCSLSQLELTVTDQMALARVQCSSINLNGDSLEQYESSPITIISEYHIVFVYCVFFVCGDAVNVIIILLLCTLPNLRAIEYHLCSYNVQ